MERVDARGKTCPLPVIETKKVLESMTERHCGAESL